jgi:hypothetical protein
MTNKTPPSDPYNRVHSPVAFLKDWLSGIQKDVKPSSNLSRHQVETGDYEGVYKKAAYLDPANVKYIGIAWHDGRAVIEPGAKYKSLESFLQAIEHIERRHAGHFVTIMITFGLVGWSNEDLEVRHKLQLGKSVNSSNIIQNICNNFGEEYFRMFPQHRHPCHA